MFIPIKMDGSSLSSCRCVRYYICRQSLGRSDNEAAGSQRMFHKERERDVSYPLNPLNQPIVNSLYRIVFLTEGSNTAQFNKSINSQYAHHKQV